MTPTPAHTIAAFDFDGTLTRRDSVVPFLRLVAGDRALASAGLRRIHRMLGPSVRRDRDALRDIATQAVFEGRSASDVTDAAQQHATSILASGLRDDTVRRLRWHVEAGHRVVIVSASYADYVRPVAAAWGVRDVLATRLEVADGICTGALDGANCRGPEKVERLDRWLAGEGVAREDAEVYAYGDSSGDREMLAWADHPTWANDPLTTVAPTH